MTERIMAVMIMRLWGLIARKEKQGKSAGQEVSELADSGAGFVLIHNMVRAHGKPRNGQPAIQRLPL
jgi:hypothetical protein